MAIVTREVARITPPSTKLSGFANDEIKPMTFGAEIQNGAGKLDYGEMLEGMLTSKLSPMLDDWVECGGRRERDPGDRASAPGPVYCEWWSAILGGAWAGSSNINMTFKLTDKENDKVVAVPRIDQVADAMAGGGSSGATDRNLLNYVVDISYHYFVKHK